jgi:3-oxoacyl-[acyl-carrier protein] reductase
MKEENEKSLKGKLAFITGAYQGLGRVTAEKLAENGADVIVNDLPIPAIEQAGEELVRRLSSIGVRAGKVDGDISRSTELKKIHSQIMEEYGNVDIVINNAGPFDTNPFLELEEEKWDLVMDVNVKAVYLTASLFAPAMKKKGWGRIVNMCAGSAYIRNHGVYGLAKAAVGFLTEELALELGPEITVNAVAPGQIEESLPLIHQIDPTFGKRYREKSALNRLVTRRDIAKVIGQICSPVFDTMTGVVLRIDAGAELPRF